MLPVSTLVVLCFCVVSVRCQGDGIQGIWSTLKSSVKEFWNSIKILWNDMKQEIQMRTGDMKDWTMEMVDSFKRKMREWVNSQPNASDAEKEKMRKYIERIQMPKEK